MYRDHERTAHGHRYLHSVSTLRSDQHGVGKTLRSDQYGVGRVLRDPLSNATPLQAVAGEAEPCETAWRDYFSTAHLKPDLRRKTLTSVSITLIAQTCAFVMATVGTIVLARLLTPRDF